MENRINWIINLLLLAIVLFALYISIQANLLDRSLWLDESMLAFSISSRTLFNLTTNILDWWQSAPVLYLYIVKLITIIFGESEFTLRIWSCLMFGATLACSYYILKYLLNVKIPLFGVAFISGLSIMIVYSNEFKPYMTDCFVVLFIIICFYWSQTKKWGRSVLNTIFALTIWLSNPVCFFIASIILIDFLEGIVEKDKEKIKQSIISASISFFSFLIYFFYWLKPVMDLGFMDEFWKNHKFSTTSLNHNRHLLQQLIAPLGIYSFVIILFAIISCTLNVFMFKNKYINIILGGIVICLVASSLGLYPIQDRMLLFIYPIIGILLFFVFDRASTNLSSKAILISLSFVIIYFSSSLLHFHKGTSNTFRDNEEFNPAYNYLLENLTREDKVYVYYFTVPSFCFKNDFDTLSIGKCSNNVILGRQHFTDGNNTEDINIIREHSPIYILATHTFAERFNPLLDSLRLSGTLSIVHDSHNTPLYYYQHNKTSTVSESTME